MRLVPRALGVLSGVGTQGFGDARHGLGRWGCSAGLVPRALVMLGGIGTRGFGDARRDWYSGLWGCSAGLVPRALGMRLEAGTQDAQEDAQAEEHHPCGIAGSGDRREEKLLFAAPRGSAGKFGRSLASPSPSRGLSCYFQLL